MPDWIWYSALFVSLITGYSLACVFHTMVTARWPHNQVEPNTAFVLVFFISLGLVIGGLIG